MWVWMCVCTYVHAYVCVCVCACIAWMFNLASEEHLTNVILSFCRYLHISVCVYVCLPQSASISSPLDLSISLLSSVRYHSLLYTYRHSSPLNISALSPSLLHSTPLTTHFNFFESYLFSALLPDLVNFRTFPPPLPPHLLLPLSFPSSGVSLCCLFDQRAVFTMKAVSKSQNHSEAKIAINRRYN